MLFSGPGLVFVVFPTALSQMPLPQLWSVVFFIVLITVAFDSLVNIILLFYYLLDNFRRLYILVNQVIFTYITE